MRCCRPAVEIDGISSTEQVPLGTAELQITSYLSAINNCVLSCVAWQQNTFCRVLPSVSQSVPRGHTVFFLPMNFLPTAQLTTESWEAGKKWTVCGATWTGLGNTDELHWQGPGRHRHTEALTTELALQCQQTNYKTHLAVGRQNKTAEWINGVDK